MTVIMVVLKNNSMCCVVVGDGMVGKSSLVKTYVGMTISQNYVTTMIERYTGFTTVFGEKRPFSVIDFAGEHEDFCMATAQQDEIEAVVVCYNVADRDSFNNIKELWIPAIRKFHKRLPIILVATQTDLRCREKSDHVTYEEGFELCREIQAINFVECSAFENTGVNDAFELVALQIIKHRKGKLNFLKKIFRV